MNKPIITFIVLIGFIFEGCSSSRMASKGKLNTKAKSEYGSLIINKSSSNSTFTIQPGDQIKVSVWDNEKFNTNEEVTSRGTITIPLVGEMEVQGLTKKAFKQRLRKKLNQYIKGEINFTVNIKTTRTQLVTVLGSVGRPDNYQVMNKVSLFNILSTAGGATDQADLRNIKIYHNKSKKKFTKIDLTDYLNNSANNPQSVKVTPGDIVYVPKQENLVHEMSSFMRDVVVLFGLFRVFN